jgi:hypothetical protein
MKNLAGMSVLLLGVLIFLMLALAVYVFRAMPYLLALVLLGEILVLAAAILAPVLSGTARKGWFGRALFALIAVALANTYMLSLARRWGVEPQGWYAVVLHWQDGLFRVAGMVVGFLDALLKAVFGLGQGPISAFLDRLHPPEMITGAETLPGAGHLPPISFATVFNILVGVLGSLWTASVVKGVLPRGGGAHGKAAAAHH